MNGAQHEDLTYVVAYAILKDKHTARRIAGTAKLPDYARDVIVADMGDSVAGHGFASTTHFAVGTELRGYCWSKDKTVNVIDLPNRDVSCKLDQWLTILTDEHAAKHPLLLQLQKPTVKAADEMEFPSSVAMVRWLAEPVGGPLVWERLGAILHFVGDRIRHHCRGELLGGHTEFEAKLESLWFAPKMRAQRDAIVALATSEKRKDRMLSPVLAAAAPGMADATAADTNRKIVFLTADVIKWWIAREAGRV